MKRYKVVCDKCGGSRIIEVHPTSLGERIDWLEDKQDGPFTIISARKRLDDQWGFQCICGANELMTTQERSTFQNPASPHPREIEEIVGDLKPEYVSFKMVAL